MRNVVENEIYKSVHNRWFAISLLLAFIVQLFSFFSNLDYVRQAMEFAYSNLELISPNWRGSNDQMNMYVMWLSEEGYTMGFTLARYMLPILAVLPFGWSLFSENEKNYCYHAICRVGKVKYYTAKYLAVFLSGCIPVAFMLISNLALCALIGEHGAPLCYTMTTSVIHRNVAAELYYTKPMLAALIWTMISALWGGAIAGLTLIVSRILKRSIFVLLFPFFIVVLWDNLCTVVFRMADWSFMCNFFLCTSSTGTIIFTEITMLVAIGLVGGLSNYLRSEVL
ncbi:MAG: hypothetical protein IIT46_08205 [Lachnospiraceae bacterium]|nr:hypothetical protein [Lachnospiraceae bacterium]MBQ5559746.1 hypothetical protein [Lachnospiraceae bacterium]